MKPARPPESSPPTAADLPEVHLSRLGLSCELAAFASQAKLINDRLMHGNKRATTTTRVMRASSEDVQTASDGYLPPGPKTPTSASGTSSKFLRSRPSAQRTPKESFS
eukprot:3172597-Alexandrium_andersonii.AAC.1